MGTCNFYAKNTNGIYSLELNDEWDFEDTIDNVRCDLKKFGYDEHDGWTNERQFAGRYMAHKTESIDLPIYFNNGWEAMASFHLEIMPMIRSGYYHGGNFDFDISINGENENYYINDLVDDLNDLAFSELYEIIYSDRWHFFHDEELEEMAQNWENTYESILHLIESEYIDLLNEITEKLNEWMNGHIDELEKVFSMYCDHELVELGRFSNGETIYTHKTKPEETA
jgi:hypothetical protein